MLAALRQITKGCLSSALLARPLGLALAMALLASPGWAAQAPAVDVQTWQTPPGLYDGLLTLSSAPQPEGFWGLRADLSYGRSPLSLSSHVAGQRVQETLIGDLGMLQLGGSLGLTRGIALGATLPIAVMLRGGGPDLAQVPIPAAPAFGDARLYGRFAIHHAQLNPGTLDIGVHVVVGVPTAAANTWLGGAWHLDALIGGSYAQGGWRGDLNLGARLQAKQTLTIDALTAAGQVQVDAQGKAMTTDLLQGGSLFLARASLARRLLADALAIRAELQTTIGAIAAAPGQGGTVADLALGADYAVAEAWHLYAALGGAPSSATGSTSVRAALGIRFDPQEIPVDKDGDGLLDKDDRCPLEAEDKDGFDDDDGCPDPDNDDDGLLDGVDKCPMAPEDKDGFEDDDGCPDPDNDADGIADSSDKCPNQAEDLDGFDDDDGCPEGDNDGDGIPDIHDLCPLQPENRNGFEDEDGCPDTLPAAGTVPTKGPSAAGPVVPEAAKPAATSAPTPTAPLPAAVAKPPIAPEKPPVATDKNGATAQRPGPPPAADRGVVKPPEKPAESKVPVVDPGRDTSMDKIGISTKPSDRKAEKPVRRPGSADDPDGKPRVKVKPIE